MKITELCWKVFNQSIDDYHKFDNIDQPINNPYKKEELERGAELIQKVCFGGKPLKTYK